jgi:hypothetical protein
MATYYCHDCAKIRGLLRPALPEPLTGTQYQLEKYWKHTAPTTAYDFNTVFTGPSSYTYTDFIVSTVSSGHVEIDDQNRTNIVLVASAQTGIALQNGQFIGPTEAVKVVLHDNAAKIHGFPISVASLAVGYCQACGCAIPL